MRHVPVNPMQPPQRLDYSTVEAVSARLIETADELSGMTEAVATARQIREFASDLRKRVLALSVREFLVNDSAAAAESRGRASVAYGEALEKQAAQLRDAELVIAGYEACMVRWKSAQSVLSSLKNIANTI